MSLTIEQKATNAETWKHIHRVRTLLDFCIAKLLDRGKNHDQSKLESPEVEMFTEYTPQLAQTTFGSTEYNELKKKLKPALDHHYANNRHHPEHFKNGIEDMNLVDLIEMICDWKASSERHNDGNIRKSIELNCGRFEITPQLMKILENTADLLSQI